MFCGIFISMAYWAYILQSETTGRFYCGQTNSLELRLKEHNNRDYHGTKTTKRFKGPWKLVWSDRCMERGEAMAVEGRIKKRGIGRFLNDFAIKMSG